MCRRASNKIKAAKTFIMAYILQVRTALRQDSELSQTNCKSVYTTYTLYLVEIRSQYCIAVFKYYTVRQSVGLSVRLSVCPMPLAQKSKPVCFRAMVTTEH